MGVQNSFQDLEITREKGSPEGDRATSPLLSQAAWAGTNTQKRGVPIKPGVTLGMAFADRNIPCEQKLCSQRPQISGLASSVPAGREWSL